LQKPGDELGGTAVEKLTMAVRELATGLGPIRDRLFEAYLNLRDIGAGSLPAKLQPKFDQIFDDLTNLRGTKEDVDIERRVVPHGVSIRITLRRLVAATDDDVQKLAERIFELFNDAVSTLQGDSE
jgi:hypothetical protein